MLKVIKSKYDHSLNATINLLEGYVVVMHKQYQDFEIVEDEQGNRYIPVYEMFSSNIIGYERYEDDLEADWDYIAEMDWED
jgi:hypothetical protein